MTKKDIERVMSNPFFNAQKNYDIKRIESFLKDSLLKNNVNNDYFYVEICNNIFKNNYQFDPIPDSIRIIKEVFLDYLVQENYLDLFFENEGDLNKAKNIINRKQDNSKMYINLCNSVSLFFGYLVNYEYCETKNISIYLQRDIEKRIEDYKNKLIISKYSDLKTIVDKITSGVKNDCYLEIQVQINPSFNDEIKEYIKNKHGYDFSVREYSNLYEFNDEVVILANLLYKNDELWKNNKFISFINLICEKNDIKHAMKIIDYCYNEFKKLENGELIYNNKLPLYFINDFTKNLVNFAIRRLGNCLNSIQNLSFSNDEINGIIYPINNCYENEIKKGKETFINFLKKAYRDDYQKVYDIFLNPNNIIQDKKEIEENRIYKNEVTIHSILESELFGYNTKNKEVEFANLINNEFSSDENILKRFYYRIYLISEKCNDNKNEYIYEYIYSILDMIDYKYGFICSYKKDNTLRDNCYNILKDKLKELGLEIKDSFKDLYIIALLDRKYANIEETNMFAELEQYGDAIYELAIDEILFYNDTTELTHENREQYVNASAQKLISEKYGFNKAYISNLHNSLNGKFDNYSKYYEGITSEGNYISDSLEMIIAVIAKEFGIEKAVAFTINLILNTFSDLEEPKKYEFDIVKLNSMKIDKDYLNKIFPSPFSNENDYYSEYNQLSYTLQKVISISIFGNETKEKRNNISHFNFDNNIFSNYGYDAVVSYLYYGIEETIKRIKESTK